MRSMSTDPFDEFFKRIRRMFKEFDREFGEMELGGLGLEPGVSGFRVEIRDRGTGKPEIKVRRFGEPAKKVEPAPKPRVARPEAEVRPPEVKPIKRMLETNAAKVEKLDEVVLTVQAPGVRKDAVEIRRFGRTLEVIARKPTGDAYFAAFELPPDANPEERTIEIKNDMLIVAIPRHR